MENGRGAMSREGRKDRQLRTHGAPASSKPEVHASREPPKGNAGWLAGRMNRWMDEWMDVGSCVHLLQSSPRHPHGVGLSCEFPPTFTPTFSPLKEGMWVLFGSLFHVLQLLLITVDFHNKTCVASINLR